MELYQGCDFVACAGDGGARLWSGPQTSPLKPELLNLLKDFPGVSQVVASGQPLPRFDCYSPLLSLPHVFGTNLDTPAGRARAMAARRPATAEASVSRARCVKSTDNQTSQAGDGSAPASSM